MSEHDKKRAEFWENKYKESENENGCLFLMLIFLGLALIILTSN